MNGRPDGSVQGKIPSAPASLKSHQKRTIPAPRPGEPAWLEAVIANVGWMPTATAHAGEVMKMAQPVRVSLNLLNAECLTGKKETALGILPGARRQGPVTKRLRWSIRVLDRTQPAWAEIVAASEKAGTLRRRIQLNPESRRD